MAGEGEASPPEAKVKTKDVPAETIDDLAVETKRTALLDRLEAQLKAGTSFTTRLLFAFNAADDRKTQRAIDQEFMDWRKNTSGAQAVNGILIYTQSVAIHLLEGPTEMIFKALECFHSMSAEVRKVSEVQVGEDILQRVMLRNPLNFLDLFEGPDLDLSMIWEQNGSVGYGWIGADVRSACRYNPKAE